MDTSGGQQVKNYTHQERKQVINSIEACNSRSLNRRILKIIAQSNIKFSNNANGVFFDAALLPNETIALIQRTVQEYLMKHALDDNTSSDVYSASGQ